MFRGANAALREAWAAVTARPVAAQLSLQVPHRGPDPARQATVTLRYCPWTVLPPPHRTAEGSPAVGVWAVQACESKPPPGVRPITWLLLTTVAVETVELTRWLLLPKGKQFREYRLVRYPRGHPESAEEVLVVTQYVAKDHSILAFKLLALEAGYTYELTWYYR